MKILILANHYNTLRIFRRELIKKLAESHDVVLSIPECSEENKRILESYGTRVVFTAMDRRGTNPLKDISLLREYKKLIKTEKADKVIAYTIKCNVYGGFACKSLGVAHYANVTGLGSAFQTEGLMRKLVSFLYKYSLNKSKRVFFENEGNRSTLVNRKIVHREQTFVLNGAGVNLDEFEAAPYPDDKDNINFLFIGRIMKEKGVDEYFRVIKRVKAEFSNVKFTFIGWYEDNYESTVRDMEKEGLLEFHGFQANVKPFIAAAHCIVHPSWHEGMSNTLLESAAMCRPLITSNIHGCKEAVEDGVNGFLTELKNEESIYDAICRFSKLDKQERINMGLRGRELMKARFDKNIIVDTTLREIFKTD